MGDVPQRSYARTVLFGNEFFEIVSCEWTRTSVSPMHDHGWSECLVLVQEGCFENRAEFGLKTELSVVETGQTIVTPRGVEHEIRCLTEKGKTLHVYVPKIQPLGDSGIFSPGTLSELRARIDLELTGQPTRWRDVNTLLSKIMEHSVSTHSPFFMNQLFSGVHPETLAAEAVIAQAKCTMATFEASPAFTAVELEVVERLGETIGWPEGRRDGIGVPGGSAANFMAVHCARQRIAPHAREKGNQGARFSVFVSEAAHYSMKKACAVLGLGTDAIRAVAVDSSGRMRPDALRGAIDAAKAEGETPLLVCATAGTTVFGAFDPIAEIAELCSPAGIWLHVDAAWGGPALFSERTRALMKGIERADSVTFDAHKLFGAGLPCSFFLTAHPGLLLEANDVAGGGYIFHGEDPAANRGRLSWQCGRRPDALSFWALWKNLGTAGLAGFVDRLLSLKEECVPWIEAQPRLELLANPEYLNVCVRVQPPHGFPPDRDWSRRVRERLREENFAFVNFSQDDDGSFLRLILAHPKLRLEHVKQILSRALAVR